MVGLTKLSSQKKLKKLTIADHKVKGIINSLSPQRNKKKKASKA